MRVTDVPVSCACGFKGMVWHAESGDDGELLCPDCGKKLKVHKEPKMLKLTIKGEEPEPKPEYENEIKFYVLQVGTCVQFTGKGKCSEGKIREQSLMAIFDDGTRIISEHDLIGLDQLK